MCRRTRLLLAFFVLAMTLFFMASSRPIGAQQNPTPIIITLTAVPGPTVDGALQPDRFEPNDAPDLATSIGWQTEAELTLVGKDIDYFTAYLKAGQMVRLDTTIYGGLDTRLTLFWNGGPVAENDDRSPVDAGSTLEWTATADGWLVALVEKATAADGRYDLAVALVAPTATPTPRPTSTPEPTRLPPATATPAPTQIPVPPSTPNPPGLSYLSPPDQLWKEGEGTNSPTPDIQVTSTAATTTSVLTLTRPLFLEMRHIGRASLQSESPATHIRTLVYYDANNDRSPGPGEGVASVSVLAVDSHGQRIARVFTNAQGEAIFSLSTDAVARVVVPFVPGWSARIRMREVNEDIVLGLPAVRLPVFLPVADLPAGEE